MYGPVLSVLQMHSSVCLGIAHSEFYNLFSLVLKLFTDYSNSYLREIGDFDVCSRVIETATSACVDKTSLLYARLMLISGNIAYDLNRLTECRNAWDITMRIRLNKLSHDDPAGKLPRNIFHISELS
jgi:hypothetical protein